MSGFAVPVNQAGEPLLATVVLRSFNRLTACCDALERCLEQDYPRFEVLVLEQSTRGTDAERARLDRLAADPRVRIERRPPLGGPGSRNEACRVARGDVIVMLDDDDMPAGSTWLGAFMRNFTDPRCLAVTGRHIVEGGKDPPYVDMEGARRKVLSYNLLMWQRCYTRIDVRSDRIQNIHGTNSAIRRSTLERFGMWDTCTKIEDENSLCYRIRRGKQADEYLVFDPDAAIVRRLDIEGGLDKRQMSAAGYGRRIFEFFHNVVAHYHTARFLLLYPAYVYLCWYVTADWVWHESAAHRGRTAGKVLTIAGFAFLLPLLWLGWLARFLWRRLRDGAPPRAPALEPRPGEGDPDRAVPGVHSVQGRYAAPAAGAAASAPLADA